MRRRAHEFGEAGLQVNLPAHLRDGAGGEEVALGDDGDVRTHPLHEVHHVGGDDHGAPGVDEFLNSARIAAAETGSTDSNGSSSTSTEGACTRAQPSAAFLRIPAE